MKNIFLFLLIACQFHAFTRKNPDIQLKEIDLFKGTVQIKVPASFKQLNQSKIKKIYPGLPTVKMVYANEDESVRIAFGSDDLLAPEQALPKMTSLMKGWLKNRLDKNRWKGEGVKEANGIKFGYLEYILKKPEKNYEHMFFTLYRGHLLSCSIHSPKKGYKFWRDIADEMMHSLKLQKEKK